MRHKVVPSLKESITLDKKYGFYHINGSAQPIDAVEETPELRKAYELKQYSKIFDNYDETTDYVTYPDYYIGPNHFVLHRHGADTQDKIPPGTYRLESRDFEVVLSPFVVDRDEYVELKSECSRKIIEDVIRYFDKKDKYENLSMLHKRACLLYGPPGNGKTYSIFKAAEKAVDLGALVIFISSNVSISALSSYKTPLSDYKVIFVLEELTDRLKGDVSEILRFLDGENSWEAYTISTTNYPEELPPNLVDRPGRFDLLIEMPNAGPEDRRAYLSNFINDVDDEIVDKTRDLSIGYLKEIVLRSKVNEQPFLEALEEIKEERRSVSDRFKGEKESIFGI